MLVWLIMANVKSSITKNLIQLFNLYIKKSKHIELINE